MELALEKTMDALLSKMMRLLQQDTQERLEEEKTVLTLAFVQKRRFCQKQGIGGYDACRSVHAEQNAIISAPRKDMIDATIYLVGIRKDTGEYEEDADSCQICKKMIINAGIKEVIVRTKQEEYKRIDVQKWIENDDLLEGKITY